jgi:drug/metabolite transporter superfamily protein YnfA
MCTYLHVVTNPKKLGRVVVALGGVLIMIGVVLMGVASLFGSFDIQVGSRYGMLFTWVLLAISICDIIAGVFLFYK